MAETQVASPPSSHLHVVVFPWLAFGHTIPFLELSKRLARRGHAVTFVSTPRNAARLGAVPPELSGRLRVVGLGLPEVEGLPDGAESTADVPPEKVALLKKAFDGLVAPFALVAGACAGGNDATAASFSRKPDWIILDFAHNWIWPIAEEHELFPLLTDIFARPVVPAGLLLPGDDAVDDDDHEQSFSAAIRWLDEQPRGSVIYVALGSEAPVTADNVRELALGLELSGARFLWALRRPAGGQLLPDGFEARVAGRGVVSAGWVPQVRVLAHAAVAAFLTHSGWGSTLESLFRFGLPQLMLPFVVDQGLIARAVVARNRIPRCVDLDLAR
ncbi:hypothetical protein C2845_PM06G30170 [Panicum miliaceum]|uniref:UDP-glycosyltransferases domain-containing protein n=1 Tax=Panicum miliaceum TaxID=4540 RepID=A0A3L6RDQ9_PANMI|nr:hypothetical protein C2845_PM06G30170 [Panicum miliaceum]